MYKAPGQGDATAAALARYYYCRVRVVFFVHISDASHGGLSEIMSDCFSFHQIILMFLFLSVYFLPSLAHCLSIHLSFSIALVLSFSLCFFFFLFLSISYSHSNFARFSFSLWFTLSPCILQKSRASHSSWYSRSACTFHDYLDYYMCCTNCNCYTSSIYIITIVTNISVSRLKVIYFSFYSHFFC